MRIVLDTNVLIDAFNDDFGAQAKLLEAVAAGGIEALATVAVRREYETILRRLIKNESAQRQLDEFMKRVRIVEPGSVEDVRLDDQEDLKIVAAAVGGRAAYIVTNDRHLLDVGEWAGITMTRPTEMWTRYQEEEASGSRQWWDFLKGIGIGSLVLAGLLGAMPAGAQTKDTVGQAVQKLEENKQAIAAKQAELNELEEKIKVLKRKRDSTAAAAELIDHQIERLTAALAKAQLELTRTKLNMTAVRKEQADTERLIDDLGVNIRTTRDQLKGLIRLLHEREQESLVRVLLSSDSLSALLSERQVYEELQQRAIEAVGRLRGQEEELKRKQVQLEEQASDLQQLERLLVVQQADVTAARVEQKDFLSAKREEQAEYEHLLAEAASAKAEIANQVFSLQNAGVQLSLTQAVDMAKLASKLTGVRAALLLGVLKVESNVGEKVGGGRYPDDMHPASREAFLRIMKKLGLDLSSAQISARPRSYSGWGGAMGPGQIMPDTWERIEGRVGQLMGKANPNPYELTDAFVATALLLADKGAANPASEYEAVNRYLAGPNWQWFTWYGDRVLAVAKEYAAQGV